jgi:hypothetical protein
LEWRFSSEEALPTVSLCRKSASRGKLFYRLGEQAVQVDPTTFDSLLPLFPDVQKVHSPIVR